MDHDGIHAAASPAGVTPESDRPGGKGPSIEMEGRVRGHQVLARIGKAAQPRRFRGKPHVIGHRDGHRLIHRKGKEGRRRGGFIIIGRLDIRRALHTCGDRGKGIGAVAIHRPPGPEAGRGHPIRCPTSDGQIRYG